MSIKTEHAILLAAAQEIYKHRRVMDKDFSGEFDCGCCFGNSDDAHYHGISIGENRMAEIAEKALRKCAARE